MKLLRAVVWLMICYATITGVAQAQTDAGKLDPQLAATLAKLDQACKDAQKSKADLSKVAESPAMTPQQKTEVADTLKSLDRVIATTTEILHDPAVTSLGGDQRAIAARVYAAVVVSNLVQRAAQRELGVPPSTPADRILQTDQTLMFKISHGWDGSAYSGNDAGNPSGDTGTQFFRGALDAMQGSSSVVYVGSGYQPSTPQSAKAIADHDHGIGGGVMLEGTAGGLGPVSSVKYDARYNALVMDDQLIYVMSMPPWDAAALCAEIADDPDTLVGVSEGSREKDTVYFGRHPELYKTSGVAQDVMLTDAFLGSVNFDRQDVITGYTFADGYEPARPATFSELIVRFAFGGFTFTAKDGELALSRLALSVTMMPIDKNRAGNGTYLPDYALLGSGWAPPPEFVDNAKYIASHVAFFRGERIVAKTVADGALAALFRSYKAAGIDLPSLAAQMANGLSSGS
jgi:hypothetical protein